MLAQTQSIVHFTYHDLASPLEINAIYASVYFFISLVFFVTKNNRSKLDFFCIIVLTLLLLLLSSKMVIFLLLLFAAYQGFKLTKNFRLKNVIFVLLFISLATLILVNIRTINQRFIVETKTNIEEILTKEEFGKSYIWTGTSIRLLQLRILSDQIAEDKILLKPGELSEQEFSKMKKHTIYGRDSLKVAEDKLGDNSFMRFAREIAYTHHEKWDGSATTTASSSSARSSAGAW